MTGIPGMKSAKCRSMASVRRLIGPISRGNCPGISAARCARPSIGPSGKAGSKCRCFARRVARRPNHGSAPVSNWSIGAGRVPNQSSVIGNPGMLDFFVRQAGLLAARNKLIILNLYHKGELIAFEYGFRFKRTYFSPKIAYNEEHSRLSPGHLLMHLWIRADVLGR